MSNTLLAAKPATLDANRRFQDEMVELRVNAIKARMMIIGLTVLAAVMTLSTVGFGLAWHSASAKSETAVHLPVVQRVNAEDPRDQIRQANELQKGKKPVPVKAPAKKVKTTWT